MKKITIINRIYELYETPGDQLKSAVQKLIHDLGLEAD